jgi:uncharacterized OsmC-like protein
MTSTARIKRTFERNKRALTLKPSMGRGTAKTKAKMVDGLHFEVEDGAWKMEVDMSEKSGGTGLAPDPGVYGRSALASCLGINYALHAAVEGLKISSLEIEVQADYDSNGNYGTLDQPPGYRQVRYVVAIEADASESEILQFVEEADKHCPYLDIFARPIDVQREVRVVASQE